MNKHFFRMCQLLLDPNSQFLQFSITKISKEGQILENFLSRFDFVLFVECSGEFLEKLLLFCYIEFFLELGWLCYEISYLCFGIVGDALLALHVSENFEVCWFLLFVWGYFLDYVAYTVYVVGEYYTTEGFDEYQAECFFNVCCSDIPKTYSQHNIRSPVIGPDIYIQPSFFQRKMLNPASLCISKYC